MWPARTAWKNNKVSGHFYSMQIIGIQRPLMKFAIFLNSSRIHEDDYRQIQTNVPFLAPEILAVFANSQIFHDNQPTKSLAIVHKSPSIHDDLKKHVVHSSDSDSSEKKLLKRLEGNSFDWTFSYSYTSSKANKNKLMCKNPNYECATSIKSRKTNFEWSGSVCKR